MNVSTIVRCGKETGTSEATNGPGIDDNVLGLETQAMDGKLDYHIHGVGFILRKWHPLQEEGQRQEGITPKASSPATCILLIWTLPTATLQQRRCGRKRWWERPMFEIHCLLSQSPTVCGGEGGPASMLPSHLQSPSPQHLASVNGRPHRNCTPFPPLQ